MRPVTQFLKLFMATFYKGAGVGTHWHVNDSRQIGFTARSPQTTPTTDTLIEHIATSTANSPYISLTRSYAVAWHYAMWGGTTGIIPTRNNSSYVYEVEIDSSLSTDLKLFDPIKEVAISLQDPADVDVQKEFSFYQHNGLPNFILGVVDPQNMLDFQVGRRPQPPGPGEPCLPNLTPQLGALVNTLRDAEILVHGHIPQSCVKNRFDVEFTSFD
jgi:hypothetical protein